MCYKRNIYIFFYKLGQGTHMSFNQGGGGGNFLILFSPPQTEMSEIVFLGFTSGVILLIRAGSYYSTQKEDFFWDHA